EAVRWARTSSIDSTTGSTNSWSSLVIPYSVSIPNNRIFVPVFRTIPEDRIPPRWLECSRLRPSKEHIPILQLLQRGQANCPSVRALSDHWVIVGLCEQEGRLPVLSPTLLIMRGLGAMRAPSLLIPHIICAISFSSDCRPLRNDEIPTTCSG